MYDLIILSIKYNLLLRDCDVTIVTEFETSIELIGICIPPVCVCVSVCLCVCVSVSDPHHGGWYLHSCPVSGNKELIS